MSHSDIRIGTMAGWGDQAVSVIKQILHHGFESFQLNAWQTLADVDFDRFSKEVLAACGDKAVISTIGIFGNPLQDEKVAKGFADLIDNAQRFNCNTVVGWPGAIEGQSVPASIEPFKKVWEPLLKRARDKGVRIAFENCDMGGTWQSPRLNFAHAPAAWELMFNALPYDNLGLEWEPCHQMVSLVDPIPNLRKWVHKIFHLHGKDATIAWDVLRTDGLRGGKPWVWHRTPGFGDTNWTDVITILRQAKFVGAIDIEGWHDPVYRGELEYTGQVHALNYLKNCRGGAFVPNPK